MAAMTTSTGTGTGTGTGTTSLEGELAAAYAAMKAAEADHDEARRVYSREASRPHGRYNAAAVAEARRRELATARTEQDRTAAWMALRRESAPLARDDRPFSIWK